MGWLTDWVTPGRIAAGGIVGINARNAEFVLPYNPRSLYPRVDDKLLTKRICEQAGIPIPATYCTIGRFGDIKRFGELLGGVTDFVIKPSHGAGGRGIVVVARREGDTFFSPSGTPRTIDDVRYHLSTLLSGLYSLGGQPDVAIVEQRIICHPVFENISVGGTPDIRIILFRGVPVMAMTRLPTEESGGRANLHQGAIAAAIDLTTGVTSGGVQRNKVIETHPDTGHPITGFEIPQWDIVLDGSMRLGDAIGMGYIGVDFVVDAAIGPVVLEANARPGLSIQVANRRGLLPRLRHVQQLPADRLTAEHRPALIEALVRL